MSGCEARGRKPGSPPDQAPRRPTHPPPPPAAQSPRAADDHQNNQDDDPAVTARGLEFANPSICRIIITPVFVITYPNLTKMKRHVWYWYFRVPVSFPNDSL